MGVMSLLLSVHTSELTVKWLGSPAWNFVGVVSCCGGGGGCTSVIRYRFSPSLPPIYIEIPSNVVHLVPGDKFTRKNRVIYILLNEHAWPPHSALPLSLSCSCPCPSTKPYPSNSINQNNRGSRRLVLWEEQKVRRTLPRRDKSTSTSTPIPGPAQHYPTQPNPFFLY